MSRLQRFTLFAALGLLGITLVLAIVFVLLRGGTPKIHDTLGRVPPRALTELTWLPLGGARQAFETVGPG